MPVSGLSVKHSQIQTNQAIQIYFNQPISSSISQFGTQNYYFNLYSFQNITLTIQTSGNISILLPALPFDSPNLPQPTNFSNFMWSAYLRGSQSYYFELIGESGYTRDFTITLSQGKQVIDHQNHDQSTAYPLIQNQVVDHILNYTSRWIDNWYNFTIQKDTTLRINLWYNTNAPLLYFLLQGPNLTEISGFFHALNITESLVITLKAGTYSIQVSAPLDAPPFSWPYHLWVTPQYQLQGPTNISVGDPLYGTITNQKSDSYNLTVSVDVVIWFYGSDLSLGIIVSNATASKTITPYLTYTPTNVANMKYITAGNYTISVSTTLTTFVSYFLSIQSVQPDFLESTGNSQANPFHLDPTTVYSGFTLHLPTDHDWFVIQMPVEGSVDISLTGNVLLTVQNGTNTFGYANVGTVQFPSGPYEYILEISSNDIASLDYTITWAYSGQGNSNYIGTIGQPIDTPTSRLKVGYPLVEVLEFILLPILMIITLRKHKKKC